MRYIVRVELHHPPEPDYDALHIAMEEEGFARWAWFPGAQGPQRLALPTAEYHRKTTESSSQVLIRAKRAVESAHAGRYSVLIAGMAGTPVQFGLPPWLEKDSG